MFVWLVTISAEIRWWWAIYLSRRLNSIFLMIFMFHFSTFSMIFSVKQFRRCAVIRCPFCICSMTEICRLCDGCSDEFCVIFNFLSSFLSCFFRSPTFPYVRWVFAKTICFFLFCSVLFFLDAQFRCCFSAREIISSISNVHLAIACRVK